MPGALREVSVPGTGKSRDRQHVSISRSTARAEPGWSHLSSIGLESTANRYVLHVAAWCQVPDSPELPHLVRRNMLLVVRQVIGAIARQAGDAVSTSEDFADAMSRRLRDPRSAGFQRPTPVVGIGAGDWGLGVGNSDQRFSDARASPSRRLRRRAHGWSRTRLDRSCERSLSPCRSPGV